MLYLICLLLPLFVFFTRSLPPGNFTAQSVAAGHLPVVSADPSGALHLVYGQDSTIYYATTSGQTTHFNQPVKVATLPGLVAGAKRGPQLAVTDQFVIVTAVNRSGDVFAYSLDRRTGQWTVARRINDVAAIAKEGFQAVAAASSSTFHSAWLDLRGDKANKIVGTTSRDGGRTWSANQVIYRSPSGTVCECCRVSMVAKDNDVYVQFRNWLDGSRDLYLAHSTDAGKTYKPAQKLGSGNWKLNACPMDGGTVVLSSTRPSSPGPSSSTQPLTVWRRENTLYSCRPGEPERVIATGRNVTAGSSSAGTALAWDEGGTVWLKPNDKTPVSLGKGQMASVAVTGRETVCVWEADGQVMAATVPL